MCVPRDALLHFLQHLRLRHLLLLRLLRRLLVQLLCERRLLVLRSPLGRLRRLPKAQARCASLLLEEVRVDRVAALGEGRNLEQLLDDPSRCVCACVYACMYIRVYSRACV